MGTKDQNRLPLHFLMVQFWIGSLCCLFCWTGCDEAGVGRPSGLCPSGLTRCDGVCLLTASNANHCGTCPNACTADQACVSGNCQPLCNPIAIATEQELKSRLLDLNWLSSEGALTYLRATAEIEIRPADLGSGYMFDSELAGVQLADEILYGFESAGEDLACWGPEYPSQAYARMTIAPGTMFVVYRSDYFPSEPDDFETCPENLYCMYEQEAHWFSCCCKEQPFDWSVIRLNAIPELCATQPTPCATDFVGTDHSRCYTTYRDYVEQELTVNPDCVDNASGNLLAAGSSCACEFLCIDYWTESPGACDAEGICHTTDFCSEVTDFNPSCDGD